MNLQQTSRVLAWGIILGGGVLAISLAWPTVLRDLRGAVLWICWTPGFVPALLLISAGTVAVIFLLGRQRVANACRRRPWTATGLALVGGTHAFIIALSVELFFLPAGSSARPMGFVAACFFASAVCILGAGVISIVSRERGTLLWIAMMIGALATLFEGPFLLQVASRVAGFEISD